ncbi:hypothetical protein [Flavobacterium sp. SM2513]|uniref:hypothetical protein n=1 Tax=Flavobacterium sp. SM2513 TaxID=3424766 RepID=UPI003D7F3328
MKKFVKNICLLLFVSSAFIACSSDDGGDSTLSGVPSGEIVSVELRNETLTGFSDDEGSQKWWTHVVSSIFSSNEEECGWDTEYENQGYFAFFPDGNYYQRTSFSGSQTLVGSWEWANSSKTKISISNQTGEGVMTVTYLNDENIVFGNKQNIEGCSITSYEQFNDPIWE